MTNPVADEMFQLLNTADGPFSDPVSFFSVTQRRTSPESPDAEHQQLLQAARQVAQARVAANP